MSKTKEELNTLKNEYETVAYKLKELNDEELGYVTGGDKTNLMKQIIKINKKLIDDIE